MKKESPVFSVIIPTRDRPETLTKCLTSLIAMEYPKDRFEVVVVDDGGGIALNEIAEAFSDRLDFTLRRQENAGPANARNTGAKIARGRFLAFTDDDCLPDPGWLRAYDDQFVRTPDAMLGGRVLARHPENIYALASQLILDMVFDTYETKPHHIHFFGAGNFAIPAELFHRAGGFDGDFRFSEDREFCDRWLLQGLRMVYVPGAVIYHNHDLNLPGFWRQYFNYGRGAFQFHQKRRRRDSISCEIDLAGHLSPRRWFCDPLSRRGWPKAIPLAATLILWQVANAAGFAREAATRRLSR